MIIVKCHLLIWHKRKLCALTNAPTVQSTQTGQWHQRYSMLTILPLRSMSCTLGNSSSLWAAGDDHFCSLLQFHWVLRRIFWKIFCVFDDDKCYGENLSSPENYKNSNLIQAMKNSVCRKQKLSEGRFFWKPNFSNIYRMFRSVDRTHDMIIVKWHEVTHIQFFIKPNICPNIYRLFRSVDWTHDMITVKWHLLIWHKRKLALWQMRHRLNPHKRVNDYPRYSMLTILPLRSMSCTLGNFGIFALSYRRRSFLQVLQSTER